MPRRRALRIIGASLAVIAVPGISPRAAHGGVRRTKAGPCGEDVRACPTIVQGGSGPDKCCGAPALRWGCAGTNPDRTICVDLCAAPNTPCPGVDEDGDIVFKCCQAPRTIGCCKGECTPNCKLLFGDGFTPCCAECCNPGQRCKDGRCVVVCPDGRDRCRGKCCEPKQQCRNGICCPDARLCGPNLCCPESSECCVNTRFGSDDPRRWACCKPPNRCDNGVCRCPSGRRSCGGAACCGEGRTCDICVDEGSSGGPDIVGEKCCRRSESCCIDKCCPAGSECCHATCCPRGTTCARSRGRDGCCPAARVFQVAGVSVCCPRGTVAAEAGCCAPGTPDCCPPDDGIRCRKGKVCVRGQCVTV